MSSLTETAFYTRKTINWIILAVIVYIILRISWSIFVAVWLFVFPPKPPLPNHAFGKLTTIKFPANATPSATLTFRLETIEGSVPRASESAIVYFMPKNSANLLGLSKAQEFAKKLEFDENPTQETKNIYRFTDPEMPLRYLRYDIISKNFIIRYLFERDTSIFTERNVPLAEAALKESRLFLQTYALNVPDISSGETKTQYLKYLGNSLVVTTSLSQSDAIRIDFFRAPIGNTPIVTPNPDEGPITFIYSGSAVNKKHILQVAYTYWPIDLTNTGTYPLKTSLEAWQELQSGGGYIARYPKLNKTVATVRKAYLGYYDSLEPQTYLQPVFVFEGDDGFLAYVPAVTSEWTE